MRADTNFGGAARWAGLFVVFGFVPHFYEWALLINAVTISLPVSLLSRCTWQFPGAWPVLSLVGSGLFGATIYRTLVLLPFKTPAYRARVLAALAVLYIASVLFITYQLLWYASSSWHNFDPASYPVSAGLLLAWGTVMLLFAVRARRAIPGRWFRALAFLSVIGMLCFGLGPVSATTWAWGFRPTEPFPFGPLLPEHFSR